MKRFVMTVALTCVLSGSALADGEVPSVGLTAPPPDVTTAPPAPGDIPSGGLTEQMAEAGLTLIQLVLGGVV